MVIISAYPGEYVATRLAAGDAKGAEIAQIIQHDEGFVACVNGVWFQEFRPAAWQEGWLDAHELGVFAPVEFFRMNQEA